MDTLEDIISFGEELRNSYNNKYAYELLHKVRTFLLEHPDPSKIPGADVRFLKQITKKTSHALEERAKEAGIHFQPEVFAIAVKYCKEAIKRINANGFTQEGPRGENTFQRMKGHLHAYAAEFIEAQAEKTHDQTEKRKLLEEGFKDASAAIEIATAQSETNYIPSAHLMRSDIEKLLANSSEGRERLEWLLKELEDRRQGALGIESTKPNGAALNYRFAAERAMAHAHQFPEHAQTILEAAYADLEKAIKLSTDESVINGAYLNKIGLAGQIRQHAKSADWLINEINDRFGLAYRKSQKNPIAAASEFFTIADLWKEAALTGTSEWEDFTYNIILARKLGMDLIEEIDPKKWIVECRKNMAQASVLHDETKELKYARESVEYSKMTIQYYSKHPEEDPHRQITSKAQDKINWYKRLTQRKSSTATNNIRAQKPQMNAEEHIEEGMQEKWN